MKVLIIGAGAGTGRHIVEQAVALGHEVTAFVRNPHQYDGSSVRVVVGDARDEKAVSLAVAGQDAVLNTIGTQTPWARTRLEPVAGRVINKALREHGVRRLIVATTMCCGDSGKHAHFFFRFLFAPTFLRGAVKDKNQMERELARTDLDWVIVRPAELTNEQPTGQVKAFTRQTGGKARRIARADTAAFMLDQLTSENYLWRPVTIATS
ncbi:NAD(P)-dependent oxidoreductase [Acidisphaera sp. L21]|uniref:NAD(P)-dependent oxidoreductase n=1 Tax=Acidisphaera sp. L21 TaxID=1641851 RepID=UPI00131E3FFC|nr:SDR family oxidoreductase [Acidisphaera sp. L21]